MLNVFLFLFNQVENWKNVIILGEKDKNYLFFCRT